MLDWKTLRDHANPPFTTVGFSWAPYCDDFLGYFRMQRWDLIDSILASVEASYFFDLVLSKSRFIQGKNYFHDLAKETPEKTLLAVHAASANYQSKDRWNTSDSVRSNLIFHAVERPELSTEFWTTVTTGIDISKAIDTFQRAVGKDCDSAAKVLRPVAVPRLQEIATLFFTPDYKNWLAQHPVFQFFRLLYGSSSSDKLALFEEIAGDNRSKLVAEFGAVCAAEVAERRKDGHRIMESTIQTMAALVVREDQALPAEFRAAFDIDESRLSLPYEFISYLRALIKLETGGEFVKRPDVKVNDSYKYRAPETVEEAWSVLFHDTWQGYLLHNSDADKAIDIIDAEEKRPFKLYQIELLRRVVMTHCELDQPASAVRVRSLLPDPSILPTAVNQKLDSMADLKKHELTQLEGLPAWRKVLRMEPPHAELASYPIYNFKPKLFATVLPLVQFAAHREGSVQWDKPHEPILWAYKLCCLFANEEQIDAYVRQQSRDGAKQPMHDLCQFEIPRKGLWTQKNWGDLAIKYGPAVTQYLGLAPQIETELGHAPESLEEVKEAVYKVSYPRAAENIALARVCVDAGLSEYAFNEALKIKFKTSDKLPDIRIEGESCGCPGYVFYKLPCNDYKGLVLGLLTNNCQHIGGDGKECAILGMTSEHSGFYVVAKKTPDGEKIVAQSWAWLAKEEKGLVFDSMEPVNEIYEEAAVKLYKAAAQKMVTDHNLAEVRIGKGGGTPEMSLKTARSNLYPVEGEYYDASRQYILEARSGAGGGMPAPREVKLYHNAHMRYM